MCVDESVIIRLPLPLSDSYAAATVVLQDDHKLILDSLERHRDNAAVVSSALNALEVKNGSVIGTILTPYPLEICHMHLYNRVHPQFH